MKIRENGGKTIAGHQTRGFEKGNRENIYTGRKFCTLN